MMEDDTVEVEMPLVEGVDCVQIRVPNLDEGLEFYRDALGLKLLWMTGTACGLGMKTGNTELVLTTEIDFEVDFKVKDVEKVIPTFVRAGGKVEYGPFEIDVGKCAVVMDPWGNRYCLLDTLKGTYDTDEDGIVNGVSKK